MGSPLVEHGNQQLADSGCPDLKLLATENADAQAKTTTIINNSCNTI